MNMSAMVNLSRNAEIYTEIDNQNTGIQTTQIQLKKMVTWLRVQNTVMKMSATARFSRK